MHKNHTLHINALSNAALKHYNLDMSYGAKLKAQCFFNAKDELTDITWAGQILVPGMPYFKDVSALVQSSINQDQLANDILKLGRVTEYKSIQSMHDLAEKHFSGTEGVNIQC